MKKATFMLLSVAIAGIVGGAMAFTASRSTGTLVCATTASPIGNCPITAFATDVHEDATLYCTNPFLPNSPSVCGTLTKVVIDE